MKTVNDGGPAFPCETKHVKYNPGMGLRDYFAAKAMQAMIAASYVGKETVSIESYEWADAMIKAREQS